MSYITLPQLTDRFGEQMLIALTDRGSDALGVIDAPTMARVLADTDAMIDGYLARRYALPLTVPQPMLVTVAAAIAIYNLHTHEPDPKIKKDYDDAVRTLSQISSGMIALTAAGVEAPSTGTTGAQFVDRERPFTEDNMKGFI